MLYRRYVHDVPVQLEGEGGFNSRSFVVGGTLGAGKVLEIEDIGSAVIVRREGTACDLVLRGTGIGELLQKSASKQQAEQARPPQAQQQKR